MYAYSDNGNRTNGGFTPGVNNRLIADNLHTYAYDKEGNVVKRTKTSDQSYTEYTWDHRNRLVKVTNKNGSHVEQSRVEYAYDGDDQLIARKVFLSGSSTPSQQQVFAYDNGQMVLAFEKAGGGVLTRTDLAHRYLWGPAVDQLLADEDVNSLTNAGLNTVLWPLTDHLGTVRDWVSSSQTVVDHVEYDSFGKRVDTTVTVDAAFGWTGRYRDPLTGLQWNHNRWYNPGTGRWMSEDPIGFEAGDANLSRYVENSPTLYTDPSGLERQGAGSPVDDDMRKPLPQLGGMRCVGEWPERTYRSPAFDWQANREHLQDMLSEPPLIFVTVIVDIVSAPIGLILTGKEIVDEPKNPWSYVGAAPGIPAGIGRYGDELAETLGDSLRILRDRGPRLGQEQGREFRIEQLQLLEFDPNCPSHVRGWLQNERRRIQQGRALEPRTPRGYELSHGRTTPAREGYDYSNSRLQGTDLNRLEEEIRRQLGRP